MQLLTRAFTFAARSGRSAASLSMRSTVPRFVLLAAAFASRALCGEDLGPVIALVASVPAAATRLGTVGALVVPVLFSTFTLDALSLPRVASALLRSASALMRRVSANLGGSPHGGGALVSVNLVVCDNLGTHGVCFAFQVEGRDEMKVVFYHPLAELLVGREQAAPLIQRQPIGEPPIDGIGLAARHLVERDLCVAAPESYSLQRLAI